MNRQNQHGISRQRNYRKDNDPVGQHDRHPPYGICKMLIYDLFTQTKSTKLNKLDSNMEKNCVFKR